MRCISAGASKQRGSGVRARVRPMTRPRALLVAACFWPLATSFAPVAWRGAASSPASATIGRARDVPDAAAAPGAAAAAPDARRINVKNVAWAADAAALRASMEAYGAVARVELPRAPRRLWICNVRGRGDRRAVLAQRKVRCSAATWSAAPSSSARARALARRASRRAACCRAAPARARRARRRRGRARARAAPERQGVHDRDQRVGARA